MPQVVGAVKLTFGAISLRSIIAQVKHRIKILFVRKVLNFSSEFQQPL